MPSSPFGPRLRALRQSRGLTLPALAIAAGITKGYLSKIEHSAQPLGRDLHLIHQLFRLGHSAGARTAVKVGYH